MMSLLCVATTLYLAVLLGRGLRKTPLEKEPEQEESSDESYSELSKKIDELNRCKDGIDVISSCSDAVSSPFSKK